MKRTSALGALVFLAQFAFAQGQGGLIVVGESKKTEEPALSDLIGAQKALVIGIDRYQSYPDLVNCVFDCKEIARVLSQEYGFQEVVQVYDQEATREGILKKIRETAVGVTEKDSLLIYFSGHGVYDPFLDRGYWVPADGTQDVNTCIPSSDIQSYVKATPARHVWVVCDSCFSGSLFRDKGAQGPDDLMHIDRYVREAISRKSRIILSAGGNEPVTADGFEGHSMFAYYFLRALENPQREWIDSTQVFDQIKVDLANNTEQTPQQGVIFGAGHERGEFFLFPKKGIPAQPTQPTQEVVVPQPGPRVPPIQVTGGAAKIAGPQIELPGGISLELIQVPSLSGLWIGKYEVTQDQWTAVAGLPRISLDLAANPSKNPGGSLPVENVSFADCVEFCARLSAFSGDRYRLPTESEWEAACSGSSSEQANVADQSFDRPTGIDEGPLAAWSDGFANTAPVGSFEPNSLGFYDLLGNVAEWCLPEAGGERVYRGGSWGHSPSAVSCTNRVPISAKTRPSGFVGFRVVRE